MKSAWFSKKPHHEFAKLLQDAARGKYDLWNVFTDWLEVAYLSLSQAVHRLTHLDQLDPEREEAYAKIVQRYDHPENFARAFGVVVEALEEEAYDFIGSAAGELELLDKAFKGQCFTPAPLCQLMAQMSMGDIDPDPEHRLMICEPCCGGGAISIATAQHLKSRGFMPWNYWMDCTDVDRKMWQACYIQLTLLGVPAVVRWGNSLSLEQHKADVTLVGALHPLRRVSGLCPDSTAKQAEISLPDTNPDIVSGKQRRKQQSFLDAA